MDTQGDFEENLPPSKGEMIYKSKSSRERKTLLPPSFFSNREKLVTIEKYPKKVFPSSVVLYQLCECEVEYPPFHFFFVY